MASVSGSGNIQIRVQASDSGSGISSVSATLVSPTAFQAGGMGAGTKSAPLIWNGAQSRYEGTVSIVSASDESGTWRVGSINISDVAGNSRSYQALNSCPTLSISNPPRAQVTMPSALGIAGITAASDPTRVLFYGSSQPKAYWDVWYSNYANILNGSVTSVSLNSCIYNGGMIGAPVAGSSNPVPVGEFNAAVNDFMTLQTMTGSLTSLTDFYHGSIDLSGSISWPRYMTGMYGNFDTFTINTSACSASGDSGIMGMSIYVPGAYSNYTGMGSFMIGKVAN